MSSQELFGDPNTYSQGIWKTRENLCHACNEDRRTGPIPTTISRASRCAFDALVWGLKVAGRLTRPHMGPQKVAFTWNPNDPCFDWKRPCFGGLTFKNRGHLGSRYIKEGKWDPLFFWGENLGW